MTEAICIKCGERKWGALTPCSLCGARPTEPREISLSMLLNGHNYTAAQLTEIGARIKRGEPVSVPDAYLADYQQSLQLRDGDNTSQTRPAVVSPPKAGGKPFLTYLWSLATQQRRTSRAVRIIAALHRGERPDFALYLHAFKDDRSGFNRKAERLVTQRLGEQIPLLSLTGEESPLGMVRIRCTDEQWYQEFLLLATSAIVIFVQAPSVTIGKGDFDRHRGLVTELRTLYERGLLGRTALIQSNSFLLLPVRSPSVNSAEILASHGRTFKLQPAPFQELISYYAQFVGVDPPRPAPGMLLAWQIMFDPEVRDQHSLPGLQ